jgi:hypothetical protein
MVKIFKKLNVSLKGNIGLKIHTGENGGNIFYLLIFFKKYMIILVGLSLNVIQHIEEIVIQQNYTKNS